MADRKKHCISLVGPHSDEFKGALGTTPSFEVHHCESIVHARKRHSDVLVLAGRGHVLLDSDVNKLLHSGTALALFKPERPLLETIHKATQTPIDIPSLELSDELPLLIYVVNDVVHVAPNNDLNEIEIEDAVSEVLDKSHIEAKSTHDEKGSHRRGKRPFKAKRCRGDILEEAIKAISRAINASKTSRGFLSNMDPPSGVIGFKKGTLDHSTSISITLLAWARDGTYHVYTDDSSLIQRYDFSWYTDYYSYATGTDCRDKSSSDFTSEGGVVYTVAINRGSMARARNGPQRFLGPTSGYCGYYFIDHNATGVHGDSSMSALAYQPRGLDSSSDKKNNYSIDYQQDMQMFNNGGNSHYTFTAKYMNSFTLDRFQQNARQDSSGVDYDINYKDYYDNYADPNFNTDAWWNPGVYEEVYREGWKHWIVREYLPADNIPINNLTVFSSSVGKFTLRSTRHTIFRAFKSSAWSTTSDGANTTHKQRAATSASNGNGSVHTLDLTWSM